MSFTDFSCHLLILLRISYHAAHPSGRLRQGMSHARRDQIQPHLIMLVRSNDYDWINVEALFSPTAAVRPALVSRWDLYLGRAAKFAYPISYKQKNSQTNALCRGLMWRKLPRWCLSQIARPRPLWSTRTWDLVTPGLRTTSKILIKLIGFFNIKSS